ncbi:MAG: hypothetical protein M3N42_05640 [Cyanobacteriota bacterium]|nr:hypothetical protein [Cyanobacteriota bacterium]
MPIANLNFLLNVFTPNGVSVTNKLATSVLDRLQLSDVGLREVAVIALQVLATCITWR